MRTHMIGPMLGATFALAASAPLFSQAAPAVQGARGRGTAAPAAPSRPAPARDLTGVWMKYNPPGVNRGYTGYTYTDPMKEPPSLTAWGEARFKEARDSNGGHNTPEQKKEPPLH